MASLSLIKSLTEALQSPTNLLAITGVVIVLYLLSNQYGKGLWRIPGPFLRSISPIPRMWSIYRTHSHLYDIKLHEKYGKIVRVAPNTLDISDIDEISHIYGITTKFVKSGFYELAEVYDKNGELLPDPFILKDKALHTRMKRGAANAYSMSAVVQAEQYVDNVTKTLLSLLDNSAQDGSVCNIGELLKNYAMDTVIAITFGKHFNYLEKGDTLKLYKNLDVFTDYMAIEFGQIPWIHKYLLKNPKMASWWIGDDASQVEMVTFAEHQIKSLRDKPTDEGPTNFMQRLLLNQQTNPSSISDHDILTHCAGNVAAGSDTTSTAMRAVLYYVLKDERVYQRLCKEVRNSLSLPISYSATQAIPYIAACIQEGMRMHPSVGLMLERVVPKGGAVVCGYPIPEGTVVGMNPFVLHSDPVIFPDPFSFKPERWLPSETSDEHLKMMNRSFFAFGSGAHTCSGRHISMLQLSKLLPTLLVKYDMTLVNGGRNYRFKNRWFTPQTGLLVTLTERKQD